MSEIKLKNRIVLFTVIICIISISSVSILNYAISIRKLEANVDTQVKLEGETIGSEIDKWLSIQKKALDEVIENMISGENFDKEFSKNYLKNAMDRNPGNLYYIAFS